MCEPDLVMSNAPIRNVRRAGPDDVVRPFPELPGKGLTIACSPPGYPLQGHWWKGLSRRSGSARPLSGSAQAAERAEDGAEQTGHRVQNGADQVTDREGERKLGKGTIRIAGTLFPDPSYTPGGVADMRYGIADYALAFSGWQMVVNLLAHP